MFVIFSLLCSAFNHIYIIIYLIVFVLCCLSLPFQFYVTPETTMRVTKDTVTISGLGGKNTVQLKDADPNELQVLVNKMPLSIKGRILKYNFSKLCLVLLLE